MGFGVQKASRKGVITIRRNNARISEFGGLNLGIQVYKQYLHRALESVNITHIDLSGSLGLCEVSKLHIQVLKVIWVM